MNALAVASGCEILRTMSAKENPRAVRAPEVEPRLRALRFTRHPGLDRLNRGVDAPYQSGIAARVLRVQRKAPVLGDRADDLARGRWRRWTGLFELPFGFVESRIENQFVRFRERLGRGQSGRAGHLGEEETTQNRGNGPHGKLVRSCCFSV
jgi:hypothetical protein